MKMFRCNFPGCGKLLNERGYCPAHQATRPKPFENAMRPNEALYRTTRWKKLRAEILQKTPFCEFCFREGALQVHHLIPPRGDEQLFFDRGNLRVICAECHRKITAQEIKQRREG